MIINLLEHQYYVERKYSKRNIHKRILADIHNSVELVLKINESVELIEEWLLEDYYASKNYRLAELGQRDIKEIVESILTVTIQIQEPQLFTAVVGEITGALKMSNKIDGTKTAAELLAVICETDLFNIYKEDKFDSLLLVSNYSLEDSTINFVEETKYLPPMVIQPNVVTKNYAQTHLTEAGSLILGKGTHHDGDICLDSINRFNQVPLTLNTRLLTTLSEAPKNADMNEDVKRQWLNFVRDSYRAYRDLIQVGNKFYLTHKVDKRGRTYAQGYHVTTQGNQFRKAIVEFADKEVIEL